MFDDEELRRRAAVEQLIAAIRQGGVAGARIGPDGTVIAGEPGWEERTKDQRLSEKAKTHGWPPGLAKSMRWRRDRLVAEHRDRADLSRDEAIEALAWALDAERFLGAFSRGAPGAFPASATDEVAEHLLVWLRERGFTLVPIEKRAGRSLTARSSLPQRDESTSV